MSRCLLSFPLTTMKPPTLAGPLEAKWASLYAGLEDLKGLSRFVRCLGIRFILAAFRVLPGPLAVGLGGWLGGSAFWVLTRYKKGTIENLERAYPRARGAWIRAIGRRCMAELGENAAYAARLSRLGAGRLADAVEIRGGEHLSEALKGDSGAVVLSAHLGCWELLPAYLAGRGRAVAVVAEGLAGRWEADLLRAERCKVGVGQVGAGVPQVRGALRGLLRGSLVICPYDQDAGESGFLVPFFGRRAFVPALPLKLAQLSGAAILPGYASREGRRHVLTFERPFKVGRDQDMSKLAGDCAARVEGWIRDRPGQWPWMHNRWKRTDPG